MGKFEWEILALSPGEYSRLIAYFVIRDTEAKEAERKARVKAGKTR